MNKKYWKAAAVAALTATVITTATAELHSRLGSAAAYDDVLNITWLTDAGLSGSGSWDD